MMPQVNFFIKKRKTEYDGKAESCITCSENLMESALYRSVWIDWTLFKRRLMASRYDNDAISSAVTG